jgi:hypothetical protein
MSLDKLVIEIRSHVYDAGKAATTCGKHQYQAGLRLLELRGRIEAGEEGEIGWWPWYKTKFTGYIKSRSYAEKLMRWASADDPEAAIEAHRTKSREGMRASRQRVAHNVMRSLPPPEDDLVERTLDQVKQMDTTQRQRFDAAYALAWPKFGKRAQLTRTR